MIGPKEASSCFLVLGRYTAWRLFVERNLGAKNASTRRIVVVHRLSLKATLLWVCLRVEYESSEIFIRLCEFECLGLAHIIATASPTL